MNSPDRVLNLKAPTEGRQASWQQLERKEKHVSDVGSWEIKKLGGKLQMRVQKQQGAKVKWDADLVDVRILAT